MDYSVEILDEIALEGLDGITLDGLWLRLSERQNFVFSDTILSDDETKAYLFRLIRRLRDIKFYKLREPRKALLSVNRYAIDLELGVITEVDPPPEELYPHSLVNDMKNHVVGSCSTYDTRINVTAAVRRLELNVVCDRYESCLILVASQRARKNSLTGLSVNPNLDLVPAHFCILERLGRARHRGEPTQGKSGLAAIGEDSKTNFYLRKYLLKKNLITKQVFKQKSINNLLSGLLLHLPRFYILVKPKFLMLTENVIKFLKEQPNQLVDYRTLQNQLPGVLKRLIKIPDFQKFVRTDVKVPYRLLYPNASVNQWKHKASDKEKKVRIMQLRNPDIDLRDVQKTLLGNCDEDDDDEEKSSGILQEGNRYIDLPLLTQVCVLLKDYGDEGLSQTEIAKKLGLSRVQARTTTKNIIKIGAVRTYMLDVGRQRVVKFCLKGWDVLNKIKFFTEYNSDVKRKLITALHNQPSCSPINRASVDASKSMGSSKSTFIQTFNDAEEKLEINIVSPTKEDIFAGNRNEISKNHEINKERLLNGSAYEHSSLDNKMNIDLVEHTNHTPKKSCKRKNHANNDANFMTSNKKLRLRQPVNETNDKVHGLASEKPIINEDSINISGIFAEMGTSIDVTERGTSKCPNNDKLGVNSECNFLIKSIGRNEISENSEEVSKTNLENGTNLSLKQVEAGKETDFEKTPIQVEITDNFQWLLPQTTKNEVSKLQDCSLKTSRLLKRSNIVIEAVNDLKVVPDIRKLAILINESEYKEGLPSKMDKKSLMRILYKLASNNHIKVYRATLRSENKVMHVNFICHVSIKPDNPIINSSIEFNKLKFHTMKFNSFKSSAALKRTAITYEKRSSFCHFPKFDRMKILHKFLVYLVHNYNGNDNLDQDIVKSKINKDQLLTDVDLCDLPKLYLPKIDERMFVPQLPKYSEQGKQPGWCLMSDVLTRMPLSLFLQLVQIPYFIPDLDDYMNHPVKKHFLVNNLPPKIRNCITATRKYIFSIYDVMLKLAYIGLLQLGTHQNKEKDQVFSYINMNALLFDTTMSRPGYIKISPDIEYPVQTYKFDSMDTVESYWHDCWKICMYTRLGAKSHVMGTDVILEHVHEKQEMIEATKAREFSQTAGYDIGYIPGDKSGAAGFDSAMFAHLKRNWHKKNIPSSFGDNIKTGQVKKIQQTSTLQTKQPLKRKLPEILQPVKEKATTNLVVIPMKSCKTKQKKSNIRIRRINPVSKSLHRKPFYDQVDKEALKRMSKLRVDWSVEEDRVLLICKIASAFICPHPRKQINSNMFLAYREVLHKQLQTSRNKTSRACQRRVTYMLRSSSTRHNVNLCIEELKQDSYIMETYGNTLEFIKQEAQANGKKIVDLEYIWRDRFKCLVGHLLNNYSSNNFSNFSFNCYTNVKSANKVLIPDTLKEFHDGHNLLQVEKKQYKPKEVFKPVESANDIYAAVVNVTIHSTLSCNSDKTSWSYHLFCIYQQYPEKILRDTLNKLRENQMVSYKKSYQVRNKNGANYYLPLSASPYQLSISYVNLMQTRYQSDTFLESYEIFKSLLECFNVCLDTQSNDRSIDLDKKVYQLQSLTGGSTAAIIELLSSDVVNFNIDIPNQIVVLDPSIETKDESYTRLVQRYKDLLSNFKKDVTSSVLFQKHNYLPLTKSTDAKDLDSSGFCDDDTTKTNWSEKSEDNDKWATQNVAKTSSRIALYLLNENKDIPSGLVPKEMDHVHDFFVVNSCTIFVTLLDNYHVIMSDKEDKSVKSKVLNDSVIKSTLKHIRTSAVFNDICPIRADESCSMEVVDATKKDEDIEDKYRIIEFDETTLDAILKFNFKDSDYCLVKLILRMIKDKKEIGLTSCELISEFGNSLNLVNIIRRLIDLSFILRAGVVHNRYIYYLYARPWLLHSYRNVRSEKESRTEVSNIKCVKVHDSSIKGFENDNERIGGDLKEGDKNLENINDHPGTSDCSIKLEELEALNDNGKWKTPEKEDIQKLKDHNMSQPIRVLMRPWIRIDGTLNRKVLDAVLGAILSHIMLNPGVSLSALQYRFLPAYQPQHIYEACEVLIKLGCIYSYCATTNSKPTLFSKPCDISVEESTGMEAASDIRYEGDKFAIINLGKFLETRPYTRDFMQCLIGK